MRTVTLVTFAQLEEYGGTLPEDCFYIFRLRDYFGDRKFLVTEMRYNIDDMSVIIVLDQEDIQLSCTVPSFTCYHRLGINSLGHSLVGFSRHYIAPYNNEDRDELTLEIVENGMTNEETVLDLSTVPEDKEYQITIYRPREEKIWELWDKEDNYIQWLPEEVWLDTLALH